MAHTIQPESPYQGVIRSFPEHEKAHLADFSMHKSFVPKPSSSANIQKHIDCQTIIKNCIFSLFFRKMYTNRKLREFQDTRKADN